MGALSSLHSRPQFPYGSVKGLDPLGQILNQGKPRRTQGLASAARTLPWAPPLHPPPRPSRVGAPACMVVVLILLYDMSLMKAWSP